MLCGHMLRGLLLDFNEIIRWVVCGRDSYSGNVVTEKGLTENCTFPGQSSFFFGPATPFCVGLFCAIVSNLIYTVAFIVQATLLFSFLRLMFLFACVVNFANVASCRLSCCGSIHNARLSYSHARCSKSRTISCFALNKYAWLLEEEEMAWLNLWCDGILCWIFISFKQQQHLFALLRKVFATLRIRARWTCFALIYTFRSAAEVFLRVLLVAFSCCQVNVFLQRKF